ncbi:hypothetical protein BE04_21560 [Sorangium cellulosum]|uniref:Uncharacterized protein n=1 Tax=Sorangium cellulosum TaxID=56 RepID=A0A150PJ96_SORCE|nr:hypothetical protein BE04_21560 [Sorangium cellulosum]KYG09601.1 hypothetical protein BE21_16935 [Sorangium cellulosum]
MYIRARLQDRAEYELLVVSETSDLSEEVRRRYEAGRRFGGGGVGSHIAPGKDGLKIAVGQEDVLQ